MTQDHSTASSPPYDVRLAWRWTILSPIAAVLVVLILTLLDPFEFESVSDHQSAALFYKLYATIYPTTHQDDIVIVTVDDSTLSRFGEVWPSSHKLHSRVLEELISYNPTAILVDLFFRYKRPDDYFEKTLHVIDDTNVPMFFIEETTSDGSPGIRQEIRALKEKDGSRINLVSAAIGDQQHPFLRMDTSSPFRPAAMAVYLSACAKIVGKRCETESAAGWSGDMEVVWGLKPSLFNCDRAFLLPTPNNSICTDLSVSFIGRLIQLIRESFIPKHYRTTDPMHFPYHPLISAYDLLDGNLHSQLATLLAGKIVIYGANVSSEKDEVMSPVKGVIPGAYVQAMAIDNLLTYGQRYIRRGEINEYFNIGLPELLPVILMVFFSVAIVIRRHQLLTSNKYVGLTSERLREYDEVFLVSCRRFLIVSALIFGLFVEFFMLSISPVNWIAVIVVAHVGHQIERWFFNPMAWK